MRIIGNPIPVPGGWVFEIAKMAFEWLGKKTKEIIKHWLGLDRVVFDAEKASVEQTLELNALLHKYKKEYGDIARKYDDIAYESIEEQYRTIVSQLKKISNENNNIIEEYVFENLEKDLRIIKEKTEGIYSKEIENAFSLGNNELLRILKKSKSNEKTEEIQIMVKESLVKAQNKLIFTIKAFLSEQECAIDSKIGKYLDKTREAYKKIVDDTKNIIDLFEKGEEERKKLEDSYCKCLTLIDVLDYCQDITIKENRYGY